MSRSRSVNFCFVPERVVVLRRSLNSRNAGFTILSAESLGAFGAALRTECLPDTITASAYREYVSVSQAFVAAFQRSPGYRSSVKFPQGTLPPR